MISTSALTIYACAITDSGRATLSCVLEDVAVSITSVTGISFCCRDVGVDSCAPVCELIYREFRAGGFPLIGQCTHLMWSRLSAGHCTHQK